MKKQRLMARERLENEVQELPTVNLKVRQELKDNEFLKKYNSKNPIHELDRERASSIMCNLVLPDSKVPSKKDPRRII